jgi:peptidyl-dipeptidase Dcp
MTHINDISIRTKLKAGDIGYLILMHGALYEKEYHYGIDFEVYVAEGLAEFYRKYDPDRDGVWIAEHEGRMVGFVLIMNRGNSAQLRYFIVDPAYRGIGLGKKLMDQCMQFVQEKGYPSCYLWTTSELPAAANIYRQYGFVLTEEKQSDAFGKPVTEQRYERLF